MKLGDAALFGAMSLSVLAAFASEGGYPRQSILDRAPSSTDADAGRRVAASVDNGPTPAARSTPSLAESKGDMASAPANSSGGNGLEYLNQRVVPRDGPTVFDQADSKRASTSSGGSSGKRAARLARDVAPRTASQAGLPKAAAKAAVASHDGALVPVGGSGKSYPAAQSAVYEPSGRFLYIEGGRGYRIDPATGALTELPGSPFPRAAGTNGVGAVTVDPAGRFLFQVNEDSDSVTAYRIDPDTGALVVVAGSPFAAGVFPIAATVDATGRYLYVANNALFNDVPSSISGYAIDPQNGALTPLPGSPYAALPNALNMATDPLGKYLYLTARKILAYAIDGATGALSPIGTPVDVGAWGIAVDPAGRFAYAAINRGTTLGLAAYAIGADGGLTPIGATTPTGANPLGVGVSRSGRYVYTANLISGDISGFRIDPATGELTEIEGSPFPASENVFNIATGGGMPRADFADVGYPYSHRLAAYGGMPPYAWTIEQGVLPPGLALAGNTGMVSGIPTAEGTYNFTVRLSDAAGDGASGDFVLTVSPHGQTAGSGNYQGLWWKSPAGSESGWGINLAHQGDIVFATWFTYDATGQPLWLAAVLEKTAPGVYAGDVFTTTGPSLAAVPWVGSTVVETTVGHAAVSFTGDNDASFDYTVNGVAQTKALTRQVFGTLPACTWGGAPDLARATNYQDLWWNFPANSEPGWGIYFTHQGDVIFVTWFTYGADGKPLWLIAVAEKKSGNVYEGPISTVTGPPFSAVPWDPATVVETAVGSTTITFADGNRATFAYTVNGVTQTKEITRQVFAPPGTICQ